MSLFQKSVLNNHLKGLNASEVDIAREKYSKHFQKAIIQQNKKQTKEEECQEGYVRDLFVTIFGYTLKPQPDFIFFWNKNLRVMLQKTMG